MKTTNRWMVALLASSAALLVTSYVAALDAGARAPTLTARDLRGNAVSLQAHRGSVVVVDFWASWCEPCGQAMPALDRIYQAYRSRGLVVIGVSVDQSADNARTFLSRTRVSFPIVHDASHAFATQFSPPTMPSTYVIDRQGIVRHVHAGFRQGDAARLEQMIRELL